MTTNRLAAVPMSTGLPTRDASPATQTLPSIRAGAFIACPAELMAGFEFWQQCLYQIGYAQTRGQAEARREARKATAMWN